MTNTDRIYAEGLETGKEESVDDYRDLFLPLIEENPTLEDALDELYESMNLKNVENQRNKVIKGCKRNFEEKFEKIKKVHPNISKNDALIICTYTYEDTKRKLCPYKILNTNLVSNDRKKGIRNVCKYFFILLKALRNLTPFNANNKILYRALEQKIITEIPSNKPNYIPYQIGNIKTFWAFTSTSLKFTTDFLGEREEDDLKVGTKFIIHGNIVGYDISSFSYFEGEDEVLLEPERKFEIINLCEFNGIIEVECNILKTPLVLEDIVKIEDKTNDEDLKNIENSTDKISEISKSKNIETSINVCNNNQINEVQTNAIGLKVKIDRSEVNNTIYFLDNTNGEYKENDKDIKHSHDNLNELTENNTTLIIDGKIVPFQKSFIPVKSGIYSVRLEFKTKLSNCAYMFCQCDSIIDIDFSEFNTQNVADMKYMFYRCSSLKTLNLSSFNTENVTDMSYMFAYCLFKSLDLKSFKTEKTTNMCCMFSHSSSLTSLDLKSFNTLNVTNMSSMFNGCSSLASVKLFSFKTDNVIYMNSMFYGCSSLTLLSLAFNTQNVTTMEYMFSGCSSLKAVNLSTFNTQNVTTMERMFSECKTLESLNLTSFNTQKVTHMGAMFYQCSSLKTVDLSSFKTDNVKYMDWMFDGCSSLKLLNLSSFNASNANTSYMFNRCQSFIKCNCTDNKIKEELDKKYTCVCF